MRYSKFILRLSLLVLSTLFITTSATAEHSVRGAQRVQFDSLDTEDGTPLRLFGWFFPARNATKAPVIIALHGCGGLYGRNGDFNQRHRAVAELLQQQGYHVLFPDSFNPRGKEQICTEKFGTRDINSANGWREAQGALQWAARQSNVDAAPHRLARLVARRGALALGQQPTHVRGGKVSDSAGGGDCVLPGLHGVRQRARRLSSERATATYDRREGRLDAGVLLHRAARPQAISAGRV